MCLFLSIVLLNSILNVSALSFYLSSFSLLICNASYIQNYIPMTIWASMLENMS